MARIPEFDPVDFLVRRRFGLKFQSRNGDIYAKWRNGHDLDDDERVLTREIEPFLDEVLGLAPDQLDARVAEERRKLVLEKREEEERAERSHPFNCRPAIAGPDVFEHWSKAAYWNQEEATALLLGRDPRYVNDRTIKVDHKGTTFKKLFLDLRDLISRATTAKQINFTDGPGSYVVWAKSKGIPVPDVLEDLLVAYGGPLRDWKSEAQSLQSKIEEMNRDHARSQGAAKTDSAITRERESLLKLIIGMAIRGYSYNPKAGRSPVVKEIASDLAMIGIPLDEDTVRKYLVEARELLPNDGGEPQA